MNVLVTIPSNSEDVALLHERLEHVFGVHCVITCDKIRLTGATTSVLLAQDYALRFLGPESSCLLYLPPECLRFFQIPCMNRHFEMIYRIIYYISTSNCLVSKGRKEDNENFMQLVKEFQLGSKSDHILSPLKQAALNVLCQKFRVDYSTLVCSESLKACLLKHLTDLQLQDSSIDCLADAAHFRTKANTLQSTNKSNAPFVEVYRKALSDPAMWSEDKTDISHSRRESPSCAIQSNDKPDNDHSNLRPVVIDGANVAFAHGKQQGFSPQGLRLALDFFLKRGHTNVSILIPRHWQAKGGALFNELEHRGYLVYTPSRLVNTERQTPYDDRVILQLAASTNAVVVSNDQYRDLFDESAEFRELIEKRLLPYVMAGDTFLVPEDPHGQWGPSLTECLSFSSSNRSSSAP